MARLPRSLSAIALASILLATACGSDEPAPPTANPTNPVVTAGPITAEPSPVGPTPNLGMCNNAARHFKAWAKTAPTEADALASASATAVQLLTNAASQYVDETKGYPDSAAPGFSVLVAQYSYDIAFFNLGASMNRPNADYAQKAVESAGQVRSGYRTFMKAALCPAT